MYDRQDRDVSVVSSIAVQWVTIIWMTVVIKFIFSLLSVYFTGFFLFSDSHCNADVSELNIAVLLIKQNFCTPSCGGMK